MSTVNVQWFSTPVDKVTPPVKWNPGSATDIETMEWESTYTHVPYRFRVWSRCEAECQNPSPHYANDKWKLPYFTLITTWWLSVSGLIMVSHFHYHSLLLLVVVGFRTVFRCVVCVPWADFGYSLLHLGVILFFVFCVQNTWQKQKTNEYKKQMNIKLKRPKSSFHKIIKTMVLCF